MAGTAVGDLIRLVQQELSERLSVGPIHQDQDFFELGLDSIDAIEMTLVIERRFLIAVDPGLLFDARTLNKLTAALSL